MQRPIILLDDGSGNAQLSGSLMLGSSESLTDAYGQAVPSYKGYFLQSDPTNGYPKWVPQSATWNGGTVTPPITVDYDDLNLTLESSGLARVEFAANDIAPMATGTWLMGVWSNGDFELG